jgi:hypothetical protein
MKKRQSGPLNVHDELGRKRAVEIEKLDRSFHTVAMPRRRFINYFECALS